MGIYLYDIIIVSVLVKREAEGNLTFVRERDVIKEAGFEDEGRGHKTNTGGYQWEKVKEQNLQSEPPEGAKSAKYFHVSPVKLILDL